MQSRCQDSRVDPQPFVVGVYGVVTTIGDGKHNTIRASANGGHAVEDFVSRRLLVIVGALLGLGYLIMRYSVNWVRRGVAGLFILSAVALDKATGDVSWIIAEGGDGESGPLGNRTVCPGGLIWADSYAGGNLPEGMKTRMRMRRAARQVGLSPDGRRTLTVGGNPSAQLFDRHTGRAVGAPREDCASVCCAGFSRDGQFMTTVAADGPVQVLAVSQPLTGPPEQTTLWAETVTGMRLDGRGRPARRVDVEPATRPTEAARRPTDLRERSEHRDGTNDGRLTTDNSETLIC